MKTLADIIKFKKEEITLKKSALSLETMKQKFDYDFSIRPFVKKIEENKSAISIVSEIKKASPSKGIIRSDFNPIEIGKIYEKNGAACLSILTDKKFFQGDNNFIKAVKREVSLPILRKDFIIDEWQIEESRYIGADCILLILSCLSFNQAKEYEDYAHKLGMSVIVEVHDLNELELANKLNSKLIGINNRNLKTMEVDINTSIKLIKNLDNGKIPISESGISSSKDLNKLRDAGFNTFLIGEAFMKENNITKMFESLKN